MNGQKTMPHSKTKDGSVRTIREVGRDRWKLDAGVCNGYIARSDNLCDLRRSTNRY